MTDFVLVHGAWQGSWCWERVTPLLEQRGHRVAAVTLTGSGDRSAELTPEVTLATHIDDVDAAVDETNSGAILVGHSYSGMVISGVAERHSHELGALVYVDSFYPSDGESALSQMPQQFQALFRQRAAEEGDGWRLPANDGLLDVWGLRDPALRDWVRQRFTDWSLNCFAAPVALPERRLTTVPRTYVAAVADDYPARAAFAPLATRAWDDGCRRVEIPTGHDVMLEAPDLLADAILSATPQ